MHHYLVNIALPVPLNQNFTYLVPPQLIPSVSLGKRVLVPFGKKYLTGIIVELPKSSNIKSLKYLIDVLDDKPTFSDELLSLSKWIAEYYMAPLGEVLRSATFQGLYSESKKIISLSIDVKQAQNLITYIKNAPRQIEILKILCSDLRVSNVQLEKKLKAKSLTAVLFQMQERGWIKVEEIIENQKAKILLENFVSLTDDGRLFLSKEENVKKLTARQSFLVEVLMHELEGKDSVELNRLKENNVSESSIKTLVKKGYLKIEKKEVLRLGDYEATEPAPILKLNTNQQYALNQIVNSTILNEYKAFLLHGITGSGKTQVYIDAIRKIIEHGKTAIVLVPEISLTPQTVRRFKAYFGNDVAVMHSQLSIGERYDAWRLAHQGKVKIVIGPRSAIFAPLKNIGLIIVDEEHDSSYKQYDATPRYNARDVALVRAFQNKSVVVLGSATPSVESYANALSGKYILLELPNRIDSAKLPTIEIVDMAKERKRIYEEIKTEIQKNSKTFPKKLPDSSISKLLQEQIAIRLQKKEGVILLQNRRGYSHVLECFECGYVEKCANCDITLTYHFTKKHLRCHYCEFTKMVPGICPVCNSMEMRMHAFGTQQVQQELQALFPDAIILRMDRDTTSKKGSHDKILKQFASGDADILLGTQMVAKGLDFARVTLVGVISADTQMLLPDFRSAESTFQLLTQVAGRAGRSNLAGEVIIQTLQPNHYSLKHVIKHNFVGFYQEELDYRRELDYPPYSRIVLIEFYGARENDVYHHAKKFAEFLKLYNQQNDFIVLGPADAAIPKIKNVYRKHVVVKNLKTTDPNGSNFRNSLQKAKNMYDKSAIGKTFGKNKISMIIDIDPQGMM